MPPRLARLVAVLAAIALVGGAFVLRGALAGDDEDTVAAGGGGGDSGAAPEDGYRVICDEDLGDAACEAIKALDGVDAGALVTLSASDAVEAMSAAEVPYDAWVTLDPWPQILDETRALEELPPVAEGDGVPVASSTLALLTYDSGGVDCATPAEWGCLAAAAGDSEIGLPDLDTAAGPLVLGAAARALLGEDFGIREATEGDAPLQLNTLLDSGDPGSLEEQSRSMVTQRGRFDGLVTTDGVGTQASTSTRGEQDGLVVQALAPETTLGVVLAPIGPAGPGAVDQLADQVGETAVAEGLADGGWDGPPEPSTGLPDPDLLYALREELGR